MKKVVVAVVLLVSLITMGSAYAQWSDSTDISVTINSAITVNASLEYIQRSAGNNDMTYVIQGTGVPSHSNPYPYIEESISGMARWEYFVVNYGVKNTGEVPVYFTGIKIEDLTITADSEHLKNEVHMEYYMSNGSYSDTQKFNPIDGVDEVIFDGADTQSLLDVGDTCYFTVMYYRLGPWNAGPGEVNITKKIDRPMFIVAS